MSEWRNIWAQAIKANQRMTINISDGENAFLKLMSETREDAMIFYERAEAYEFHQNKEKAKNDYIKANQSFPAPHWQKVAELGLNRISNIDIQHNNFIHQWNTFHEIHTYPFIPHSIRINSLTALEVFDSLPNLTAGILRNCLEQFCEIFLEKSRIKYTKKDDLFVKINLLYEKEIINDVTFTIMDKLRDLGNEGVHNKGNRGCDFYLLMLDNYITLLSIINYRIEMRVFVNSELLN
jgi:hypothetical protein